ncbi:50S ribosomal protein L22 [Patescibacteria group bacterium]|nr:50S ribosomal protein L22 [Patescibacteria group bacterium]MBU1730150.1 50S ribosomal protein L22 [Patescibacteria group bacterium]MBU1956413.1 50S ribosomal protein L22 [Patescibacteria group bacterium]
MMSIAQLNKYRQSPRKVRLVADVIRGKKVKDALQALSVLRKRAALPIKKLLQSAIANAIHNDKANKEELMVSEIRVDEGATLKRSRARARGRAFPIRKRTSRVMISLTEKEATTQSKIKAVASDTVKKVDNKINKK